MKTTGGRLTTVFVALVCTLLMGQVPRSFGEHKHGEKSGQKTRIYHKKKGHKAWKDREEQKREARKHREEQAREARKQREKRGASHHHGSHGHQGGSPPASLPPAHGPTIEVETEYGSIGVQL